MIFSKIRNEKVADAVIRHIEDLIVEGVLRPGDRLPAERELAKRLDVSRPSLREAIKALEERGLLKTRRGGGTFVGNVIGSVFADEFIQLFLSNDRAITDYIEFRREIDILAAGHAAIRATDADKEILSRIQNLLRKAMETKDEQAIIRCDTDFHIAVVAAAHNVVLLHAMRSIYEQMVPIFYRRLPHQPDTVLTDEILAQHGAILQAILDGDSDAARHAAGTHGKFIESTLRDADLVFWRECTAQRRFEMLSNTSMPRQSDARKNAK
ncbi:MAG: FadR family transcriptional regulator [Hyphomicrobiaceae bacterium]|nr:FadR family transcriptional regulator [Hyphomicrobiaceae bacterium]